MGVKRGEVYLIQLEPVVGSEVGKTRPCVVVSPDELNTRASTFIAAPLSTKLHNYPSRVDCEFRDRRAQAQLDQIRCFSPLRVVSKLGELTPRELERILDRLGEMFAP